MSIFKKVLTVQQLRKITRYQIFGITLLKFDEDYYRKIIRILGVPFKFKTDDKAKKSIRDEFDGNLYQLVYDLKNENPWHHFISIGYAEGKHYFRKGEFQKIEQEYIEYSNHVFEVSKDKKILIHCFIKDIDALNETIRYLKNIPFPFYLRYTYSDSFGRVISTALRQKMQEELPLAVQIEDTALGSAGQDALFVLNECSQKIFGYDFFAHFVFSGDSISGRAFTREKYQLNTLLGNRNEISQILHHLDTDNAGLVFPESYWWICPEQILRKNLNWSNKTKVLYESFAIKPLYPDSVPMPGKMFWANTVSLISLVSKLSSMSFSMTWVKNQSNLISYSVLSSGFKNFIVSNKANTLFDTANAYQAYQRFLDAIFDEDFYKHQHPEILEDYDDIGQSYEKEGYKQVTLPSSGLSDSFWDKLKSFLGLKETDEDMEFNPKFYLKTYFSVLENCLFGRLDIYQHYQTVGKEQGFLANRKKLDLVEQDKSIDRYKFSIIIPVYKSEAFLENCLHSAYNQTVKNLEIVIVNDGSPDNSQTIIDRFCSICPNQTKVIVHETNKGLVTTHTDGINAATGDFFAIMDGDDWLSPDFCEKLGNLAIAYEADCVCCRWTRPSQYIPPTASDAIYQDIRILEGDIKDKAIVRWGIYPNIHYGLNRKLYKTDVWKKLNPLQLDKDIINFEDAVGTIRFMLGCHKVITIRNRYYHWFFNPNSVGSGYITMKMVEDIFKVIIILSDLKRSSNRIYRDLYKRNLDNIYLTEFVRRFEHLYENNIDDAKIILKRFRELFQISKEYFTHEQVKQIEEKLTIS